MSDLLARLEGNDYTVVKLHAIHNNGLQFKKQAPAESSTSRTSPRSSWQPDQGECKEGGH